MASSKKPKSKARKSQAAAIKGAQPYARIKIEPTTKLAFNHARTRGGIKSDFVALAPKKGAVTAAKLQQLGKKELGIPASRSGNWLPGFVRRGFLRIHDARH